MTEATSRSASRAWFVVTICAGSFLLFLVQPMIARMALPRVGGAPAVWNSAMLVYQALLLAGYGYAHWLGRFTGRTQAYLHLALFLLAALTLPIGLAAAGPPAGADPVIWVPWRLLLSIGPLFFVVSAQAPLIQRWYALSGGGDPYPLYAASNLGSFAGLIAYPLLVEPFLSTPQQSWLWSGLYLLLAALVGLSAWRLPRGGAEAAERRPATPARQLVMWIVLAAVPSGLMLSTTTHLTTDIVAMPLLWVLPLGLYLLSFSVAFADRRSLAQAVTLVAPLVLLAGAAAAFVKGARNPLLYAPLDLILMFVVAVALHTALFERRPEPARLTAFYFAMAFGGMLGGVFCAIVAPVAFDWAYEHPILVLAAALLLTTRPLFGWLNERLADRQTGLWVATAVTIGAILLSMVSDGLLIAPVPMPLRFGAIAAVIVLALLSLGHRWAFGGCVAALMLSFGGWDALTTSFVERNRVRSYFGIYAVGDNPGPIRYLIHGTTIHGLQDLRPGEQTRPISYYAPLSGVGLAMRAVPELYGSKARIGVVGLGAGTLACFTQAGQDWRFYEIDPAIERIARDRSKFTFLARCNPDVPVAIGDARVVIAQEPPSGLDVLVIDAFSSDTVPMHLMTREAMQGYARRLAPGGLLMMHISNRHLDLEPVLAAERRDGWHMIARDYKVNAAEGRRQYTSSLWVALSKDAATIARLRAADDPRLWRAVRARPGFRGWTDDHASILPLLRIRRD